MKVYALPALRTYHELVGAANAVAQLRRELDRCL